MNDRIDAVKEFLLVVDWLKALDYQWTNDEPHSCVGACAQHFSTGDHVFWCEEHKVYTTEDSSG
jgi:hypothetical protein